MDGRREGGPEEDGCHKLEDTCTQKRRLEDGREGDQGPTRTVEPWSSSNSRYIPSFIDNVTGHENINYVNMFSKEITSLQFYHGDVRSLLTSEECRKIPHDSRKKCA